MYKLLIIEDEPSILKMLRSFFTLNGAEVLTAEDGLSGLEMVQSSQPDVIILDVVLPYIDGFSIIEILRRESNYVPIILLTEKNQVEEKVKGLELGANDYVTKPFSTKELLARVKCQLRHLKVGNQDQLPAHVAVGSIIISPRTREVHVGGIELIPLTKTEFNFLYYLVQRKRQVVTHTDLLQEVLGYNSNTKTKSLVIHISNIRRKLQKAGAGGVQITAVAGVGYMLVD